MSEPGELALDPPVAPQGVLTCEAHDQGEYRAGSGWPARSAGRVGVLLRYQESVPPQEGRRGHGEHLRPPMTREELRECCQPGPVRRFVPRPGHLSAQYRILVPQYQDLRFEVEIPARDEHQEPKHTPDEQVDHANKHPMIMPERGCPYGGPCRSAA